MKKRQKEDIPSPLQNQGAYSLWMMTKTKVQRQNQEVLELRRKTIVTNTMRPFRRPLTT